MPVRATISAILCVQVRWTHPTTGVVHAFTAAVVHVFRRNRELDVAVLQALPTTGACLSGHILAKLQSVL